MEKELTGKELFQYIFRKIFVGDTGVWVLLFALLACSLIAIYSSTLSLAFDRQGGDFNHYLINQIMMIWLGFVVMIIIRFIPIKFYRNHSNLIFYTVIILMVITLIFGKEINGAKRWIVIFGYTIQTSDFLKIGLFIYLSSVMWKMRENINRMTFIPIREILSYSKRKAKIKYILRNNSAPLLLPIAVSCVLILSQNLSTALILGLLCLLLLLLGGVNLREVGKMILLAVVGVSLTLSVMAATGVDRYTTWENRFTQFVSGEDPLYDKDGNVVKSYILKDSHRVQSDIAIANGYIIGVGLGEGVQRSNLPNSYSDFIYSVIVEEVGLVGGFLVMMLYAWMFYRTTRIAKKCEDSFSALLCVSMGLLFCGSAFSHIAVCVGLLPITGLTLPLVSHGGTSIVFSFCILGIIQKISYEQKMAEKRAEQAQNI